MTKIFLVLITGFVFVAGGLFWWSRSKTPELLKEAAPVVTVVPIVPLPTEEDIIRTFFNLINEHRIPEAIGMMNEGMVPDESAKQAWGVQFNDIKSVQVQNIEPFWQEQWTENRHTYKVTLEVYVSSAAANAPIPYYGWGDNPNIRWVAIEKNGYNLWKIAEIATGP